MFQFSPAYRAILLAGWVTGTREATMQNMITIGFAIFGSLLIVAVATVALALTTDLTVLGALVLLALLDAVILIAGYVVIRSAASSSP